MEEKAKFNAGDIVEIINYGSLLWIHKNEPQPGPAASIKKVQEDDNIIWYDKMPELVGKRAVVLKSTVTQNYYQYSLSINGNHISWFTENQLKAVEIREKELLELEFENFDYGWTVDLFDDIILRLIWSDGWLYPQIEQSQETSNEPIQIVTLTRVRYLHTLKRLLEILKHEDI